MEKENNKTREKDIEQYLTRQVGKAGGMAVKQYNPWLVGMPDRLVLMPDGRAYFVELKAEGKKPRATQILVHRRLEKLGFPVRVIDSKEGVDKFMEGIAE